MIGASIAMVAVACLFVVFGVLGLADGRGCEGSCAGCGRDCEGRSRGGSLLECDTHPGARVPAGKIDEIEEITP